MKTIKLKYNVNDEVWFIKYNNTNNKATITNYTVSYINTNVDFRGGLTYYHLENTVESFYECQLYKSKKAAINAIKKDPFIKWEIVVKERKLTEETL